MKDIALDWKRIPYESRRFTYQIRADGEIIRTSKICFKESRVRPYMKHGKLTVKIAGKEYHVKHLVAAAFVPEYRKGMSVILKNGNPQDCFLKNIAVMEKSELGKATGHLSGRKLDVNVAGAEYRSVRQAAKALHCSYQTLSDYLNGKVKNSVLSGLEVSYAK